jgi:hypothetical protein
VFEPKSSTVQEIKVRATGRQVCTVDVVNVGTMRAGVSLTIGDVVCTFSSPYTLTGLHFLWASADHRPLPKHTDVGALGGVQTPGLYRVLSVVPFTGRPPASAVFIPNMVNTANIPAHLRLQFGPVVWQVTDRSAFFSVLNKLDEAVTAFKDLKAKS